MNRKNIKWLMAIAGLLLTPAVVAIDFDEVRDFEDVFVISGKAPSRDLLEVRWDIEENYYLYNNRFLRFISDTEGVVLGEPILPRGEVKFDELLGEEVETYHDELTVRLPLESVPAGVAAISLKVRSQGCLENELCYPPSQQLLSVSLPPASAGADPLAHLAPPGTTDPLFSQGEAPALQPEQAFVFESIGLDAQTALVRFTAQPGYYLYRDKFEFRVVGAAGLAIRSVELPPGVIKDDPEFGPVPVYYGQVEIPLRLNRAAGPEQEISLEADFQGCRDGDICYPPMSRGISFLLPASATTLGAAAAAAGEAGPQEAVPRSEQDQLAGLLTSNPARAILAFFIAGLLLAFTPCVFPMVPILSGIIIGQGESLTTPRAFWLSLVYVLAMAVTYTVAGVLAGLFGQNLQAVFQNPWIISGFVLVFVLLALSMFGFYELQLPGRLQTRLTEALVG
jgi:thiol:disulfide interchange protein DsbD